MSNVFYEGNADGDKVFLNSSQDGGNDDIIEKEEISMNTLPRYEEAVIPKEKFTEYSLNPQRQKDKARAFDGYLGYNLSNVDNLIKNIRQNLPNYPAVPRPDMGYGQRYQVNMSLLGPNGKTANVLTAWIDDRRNGEMRLTSSYIDK